MKSGHKSLGKVAKRGVAWSFARESATEIILFPASMVIARLLSPAEFGIAAAAMFFAGLAMRLGELGFNAALVRAKVVEDVHLSTVFFLNLVVGVFMFGVLTVAAPLVAGFYRAPQTGYILPVAATIFLITPFGAVQAAILSRAMRFRDTATIDVCHVIVRALATLGLAWAGFSYMSLVYGRIAAVLSQVVLRIMFVRWRPSLRVSWSAFREVFPFGAGVHAKRLLEFVAGNISNLLVGRLLGMTALGIYDKAFGTMDRILSRFNSGGPNVTFRIFAVIHDQPERLARAYEKVVMASTLLAFPIFAVCCAVAEPLMAVLFGERWIPAAAPFQLLCVVGCLRVLNSYAGAAIQAAGWIWSQVWRTVGAMVLLVAGMYAFHRLGVVGAALAVLLSGAIMTLVQHMLLKRVVGIAWRAMLRPQIPGIACAVGCVTVVLLMKSVVLSAMPDAPYLVLLVAQLGAATLFAAIFVLFTPYQPLRSLVHEMTVDFLPESVRRSRWVQSYLQMQEAAAPTST